ncbi:uncharacterized protein BX664DRAFT_259958 [Halteromyces radiatus]|uniref:uncharacterized protein n=1 Tax=Halteromyces radiatus TaxID=101107 RepID=UPI00221EA788|nr:uncharacterized protein BX664DRAFT_259958 [Halteromyces radiatus]KAI8092830.1 hypothetical protein BX664DRAFT_259958 [Halteromyces radiatus]
MSSPPRKTEPISILKVTPTRSSHVDNSSTHQTTNIVMSEDEDEEDLRYTMSDGEDEDPAYVPSGKALELLQTEKTWKKRWFVLRTTKLAMYKDKKEYKLLRIIDLHDIHSVVQVTSKNKYRYVFAIITPKRMYYVQADDQKTMDGWFEAIDHAKEELRLYDADDDSSSAGRDQEFAKDVVTSYKSNSSITQQPRRRSSGTATTIEIRRQSGGMASSLSSSPSTTVHFAEGIASSEDDEDYSANNSMIDIRKEEDRNRVLVEGYLLKLGRNKGWQKRWFVLRTDTLSYYENEKEYSPHRIIPLNHIIDALEIEAISKNKQHCFKIIIPKRNYVLCASTENDLEAWERKSSLESFDNSSHLSGVSGAGGVGGAGGALGRH